MEKDAIKVIDTQKLRQQLAEATPEEWTFEDLCGDTDCHKPEVHYHFIEADGDEIVEVYGEKYAKNADLICSMKNSLPTLLDEVEALRAFAGDVKQLEYGVAGRGQDEGYTVYGEESREIRKRVDNLVKKHGVKK